ncbi:hypothetical protein AHAS_Ahas09G0180900 [Arachis hypogaea]
MVSSPSGRPPHIPRRLQSQVEAFLHGGISSSVASHLQGCMCSSVIPPSAIPFTFSLTQPAFAFTESLIQLAFLMDLFEQVMITWNPRSFAFFS